MWGRGGADLVEGAAESQGQGEFGLGVGVAPLKASQVFLCGGQVVGGGGVLAVVGAGVQAGAEFGAGAAPRVDERGQCVEVLAQQVQGAR
ncbi:hypothetical protein SHO565_51710 [Streptomyces sp. HO565]